MYGYLKPYQISSSLALFFFMNLRDKFTILFDIQMIKLRHASSIFGRLLKEKSYTNVFV